MRSSSPVQFAEQVPDDSVGPARQVFEQASGLAAHRVGLQWQHVAELCKKSADAVDAGGARLHQPMARPVHHELTLLLLALDRHEAHVRALHRLAQGSSWRIATCLAEE